MTQGSSAAGDKQIVFHADSTKGGRCQAEHHALHALIVDQQVRTAAQQANGDIAFLAAVDEKLQFFFVGRFGKKLRVAPQAQPTVLSQRLIGTQTML